MITDLIVHSEKMVNEELTISRDAMTDNFEDRLIQYERNRRKRPTDGIRLTPLQVRVLRRLSKETPLKEKTLREKGIGPVSLSRAISVLHKNGMITRDLDAKDAREHRLSTTDAGRQALRKWDEEYRASKSEETIQQVDQQAGSGRTNTSLKRRRKGVVPPPGQLSLIHE